jgi:hypothetical protein
MEKDEMKKKIILALVTAIALCGQVLAEEISGVSVYDHSGHWAMYVPEGCINGAGLNYNGVADTHICINDTDTQWYDEYGPVSWITVDLGGISTINELKIWNLNIAGYCSLGWRYAQVLVSLTDPTFSDPAQYQYLGEIEIPMAPSDSVTPYGTSFTVSHTGNIRYVKLVCNGTWAGLTRQAGLAEIKFYGTVTPVTVPLTLIGYWPLNGNADDASGNGNNGTNVGGLTYTAGQVGQCAQFNGVDSGITIANPANFEFTDEISLSFWVNQDDVALGTYSLVINKFSNTMSALDGWMVFTGQAAWTSTGMNAWMANTIEGGHSITSSCVGAWHHIAVTYKGKDVTAYYDGKLATNHVYQGRGLNLLTTAAGYPLAFGHKSNPLGEMGTFWSGKLDEVRFYHGTLSAEDVIDLYQQGGGIVCDGDTIPEDINKDCKVNFADFAMMAAKWLECYAYNNYGCE